MRAEGGEKTASQPGTRVPLSRARVLKAALQCVDEQGLAALTLRRLATDLGVEAMSLYRHVDGKDGLLDGVVELLWSEVEQAAAPDGGEWRQALRRIGHALRDVILRHRNAAPLLASRSFLPQPALRLFNERLQVLQAAGLERSRAADVLRTVITYAFGHALMELSLGIVSTMPMQENQLQTWHRISGVLPPDTPLELFEAAFAVCGCDTTEQFTLGMDLMLRGLAADAGIVNATGAGQRQEG